MLEQDGKPVNSDGATGLSGLIETIRGLEKGAMREKVLTPTRINGQLVIPPPPQFRGILPPFVSINLLL